MHLKVLKVIYLQQTLECVHGDVVDLVVCEGEVEDHGQAAEALPLQPREVVVVEAEQPQRLQRAQGLAGRRGHPVTAQVELLQ